MISWKICQIVKNKRYANIKTTSMWNLNGFLLGIITSILSYYKFGNINRDIVCFMVIICMNFKLIFHKCNTLYNYSAMLIGPSLFLLYTIYSGSFYDIINIFSSNNITFVIHLFIIYGIINFINP